MKLNIYSLSFKLNMIIAIILGITFLIISFVNIFTINRIIEKTGIESINLNLRIMFAEIERMYNLIKDIDFASSQEKIKLIKDKLIEQVQKERYKTTGYFVIFDSKSNILALPPGLPVRNTDFPFFKLIKQSASQTPGKIHVWNDREIMAYYFEPWDWYICLSIGKSEFYEERNNFIIFNNIFLLLGLIAVMTAISIFTKAIMFKRIKRLTNAATRISQGDFQFQIDYAYMHNQDEINILAKAFNQMLVHLSRSIITIKEKERVTQDREVAQSIQQSIIPRPVFHEELEISADILPAEEVGGDYYDILTDTTGHLWFAIADVTGHGIKAGLIALICQSSFAGIIKSVDSTPSRVLARVNDVLYENLRNRIKQDYMMTMCVLKYLGNGAFAYSSAAHPDIIVYRKKTNECEFYNTRGVYLGLFQRIGYAIEENEFNISNGDIIFLYTDGIPESRTEGDVNLFGYEKLAPILIANADKDIDEIKKIILQTTLQWCGSKLSDDVTLILIKLKESPNITLKYNITPDWKTVQDVSDQLKVVLRNQHKDIVDAVIMASIELMGNAIKYRSINSEVTSTDIVFELNLKDYELIISVSNSIASPAHLINIEKIISSLQSTTNPKELYSQRLLEILYTENNSISNLGLYRIAYEGEFDLSYKFVNNVLTVNAKRSLVKKQKGGYHVQR